MEDLYRQEGDDDSAMPLMLDTLSRQRDRLGETHPTKLPTTLIAAQEMADLLLARGDGQAAGALYLSILDARKASCNEEHPDSIATLAGLAEVRRAQGDVTAYREFMRRASDLAEVSVTAPRISPRLNPVAESAG
ncbi:MAG: tetratricopeptide repeat protein [Chromatocurvus sp.]